MSGNRKSLVWEKVVIEKIKATAKSAVARRTTEKYFGNKGKSSYCDHPQITQITQI